MANYVQVRPEEVVATLTTSLPTVPTDRKNLHFRHVWAVLCSHAMQLTFCCPWALDALRFLPLEMTRLRAPSICLIPLLFTKIHKTFGGRLST